MFSGPDWPVLFRGEATGFLTTAAGAGLTASEAVAAVVGLCVGERPAGLGAIAGLGGSLGFSGLGLDSAVAAAAAGRASSSSLGSGGGGGGGGAGAVMACRGFSCLVW